MRKSRGVILFIIAIATSAQEITPPKNWGIEKQSGQFIFHPQNLPAGQTVQVEIFDSVALPVDMTEWLATQMKSHGATSDDLASCRPKTRGTTETSCVTKSNGADQYWYAFKTPNDQARFAHATMGPTTLATMGHIAGVTQLLKKAEANIGRAGNDAPPAAPSVAPTGDFFPSTPIEPSAPAPAATPIPVTGSSYEVPVEGLFLHLEYIVGVGGGVYPSYEPYIFLPDGTVTDDLSYYPASSADIANWHSKKPRAWGRYTKTANSISIRWSDPRRKPETWDKWFVAKAGTNGMPLSGNFRSIGGGGNTSLGGNVMVAAWSNFRFSPNGTVVSDQGAGGGTPNATAMSQHPSKQANYRISNYIIDFQYGDGRRERSWFFRFPDSDDVIGVGNKVLTKK